ncbi:MAG: alpha/beta hydrolase family protein [Jatrophihabitans sp.]|uniref:alpha/beta hydrolase family protein n=1 Tax=Jatrophihabitans sp. TaxID=1932789 RepID=UPI003F7F5F35
MRRASTPSAPHQPSVSRRHALLGAGGIGLGALVGCDSASPSGGRSSGRTSSGISRSSTVSAAGWSVVRHSYGNHAAQFGDLYLPEHRSHAGVVVVLHGGFWLAEYDLDYGAPLAKDLAGRGYAVLNLEYRRVGDGGGWPTTFDDIGAGIDLVAALPVGDGPVTVIGHSAGGQLAVWAASRTTLPAGAPGSRPRVRVHAVISQAGVLDLRDAANQHVGGTAVEDLLGGSPDHVPGRYRIADPVELVPSPVAVCCVHSRADQVVPYSQSEHYVAAARAAGGAADLLTVAGDHFTLIDPTSAAWHAVLQRLPSLMAAR